MRGSGGDANCVTDRHTDTAFYSKDIEAFQLSLQMKTNRFSISMQDTNIGAKTLNELLFAVRNHQVSHFL